MSMADYQPDAERLIVDIETLKVYFDPLRLRILRTMAKQPRSVQEIAEELHVPFTRLYYHINMLEKHGLIRVIETRNFSGAVEEKFYQVTAQVFVVDRRLMTVVSSGVSEVVDVVLNLTLDETGRDIRNGIQAEIIDLDSAPPAPDSLYIRRSISKLRPDRASEFYTRLNALLQEFNLEEGAPEDQYYALLVGLHPVLIEGEASDASPG